MQRNEVLNWLGIKYPGHTFEVVPDEHGGEMFVVLKGEELKLVFPATDASEMMQIVDRLSIMTDPQLKKLIEYVGSKASELSYEQLMCGLFAVDEVDRRVSSRLS